MAAETAKTRLSSGGLTGSRAFKYVDGEVGEDLRFELPSADGSGPTEVRGEVSRGHLSRLP